MRILIVGMHNSPHLHRWVRMIDDGQATILIFTVLRIEVPIPSTFKRVALDAVSCDLAPGVWIVEPLEVGSAAEAERNAQRDFARCTHTFVPVSILASPERLLSVIEIYRPDVLHSLETQLAGYLCLEAFQASDRPRPPWIASTWGSDLHLFHRFTRHREMVRRFCSMVDALLPDCVRDLYLGRQLGYGGPALEAMPATGGADVEALAAFAVVPPSKRRSIIVKGYHNWSGRGLLALSALALAREHLQGYSIGILAPGEQVRQWAFRLTEQLKIEVEPLPYMPNPDDATARLASARAVIGISASDGLPTMVLEAMATGAFPIQSTTSCVNEWLVDGETGHLVSPHDTAAIARAIVDALTDDARVDEAARRNLAVVRARWSIDANRRRIWDIYHALASSSVIVPEGRQAIGSVAIPVTDTDALGSIVRVGRARVSAARAGSEHAK